MSEGVGQLTTEQAFPSIESYLTSTLPAQQQAAIECMANLSLCKACSDKFITESHPRFPNTYNGERDPDTVTESRFLQVRAMTEDEVRGVRLSAMTTLYNVCESSLGVRMLTTCPLGVDRIVPQLEAMITPGGDRPDGEMRARVAGVICKVLQHGGNEDVERLQSLGVEQKLVACKENDSTGKTRIMDLCLEFMLTLASGMVSDYADQAIGLLRK